MEQIFVPETAERIPGVGGIIICIMPRYTGFPRIRGAIFSPPLARSSLEFFRRGGEVNLGRTSFRAGVGISCTLSRNKGERGFLASVLAVSRLIYRRARNSSDGWGGLAGGESTGREESVLERVFLSSATRVYRIFQILLSSVE